MSRSLAVNVLSKYIRFSPSDMLVLDKAFAVDVPSPSDQPGQSSKSTVSVGNVNIDRSEGIVLYHPRTGNKTVSLDRDGDAAFGSDIDKPSNTSLRIFSNDQGYNGETVGAGDLLLGDNSDDKANVYYDASEGTLNFRTGETTHLYISTSGDLILDGVIRSDNYVSFVSGFEIDAETGDAEFNNVRIRGAMTATVLTTDNLHALGASLGIYKSASKVHTGFTTAAQSSTTTAEIDNDPSGNALFVLNDYVYMSFFNGTSVKAGYLKVTDVGANSGEYTTYTLETISVGIASTAILEGTPIADYGVTGDGRVMLRGGTYPYIDISIFDSTGPSNESVLRAGDLDGVLGISSTTYGFACGDLSTGSKNYLKATNDAVELMGGDGGVLINEDGITITCLDAADYSTSINAVRAGEIGSRIEFWAQENLGSIVSTGTSIYSGYTDLDCHAGVDVVAVGGTTNRDAQVWLGALQVGGSPYSVNFYVVNNWDENYFLFNNADYLAIQDGYVRIEDGGLHVGGTSDPGADNLWVDGYAYALGGLHVGGTSDPTDDTLVVDGLSKLDDSIVHTETTSPVILRYWVGTDEEHNFTEIIIYNFTIAIGSSTTAIDTGIDLTTYGSTARGGYKAFGTITSDTVPNSHQAGCTFSASMRYTTVADETSGTIHETDTAAGIFNACRLNVSSSNIMIEFDNTNVTYSLQTCTLHMTLIQSPL